MLFYPWNMARRPTRSSVSITSSVAGQLQSGEMETFYKLQTREQQHSSSQAPWTWCQGEMCENGLLSIWRGTVCITTRITTNHQSLPALHLQFVPLATEWLDILCKYIRNTLDISIWIVKGKTDVQHSYKGTMTACMFDFLTICLIKSRQHCRNSFTANQEWSLACQ